MERVHHDWGSGVVTVAPRIEAILVGTAVSQHQQPVSRHEVSLQPNSSVSSALKTQRCPVSSLSFAVPVLTTIPKLPVSLIHSLSVQAARTVSTSAKNLD